jgi:hypothetical protein
MNVGMNVTAMMLVILFRIGFWLERNTEIFRGELNRDLSSLLNRWALTDNQARYFAAGDLQKLYARQMGHQICPVCGWAIDEALPVSERPLCLPHPDCERKLEARSNTD